MIEYRKGLIEKIGLEKVEWLEKEHPPKRYRLEDYKEIYRIYTEKLRELKHD